MGEIQSKNNKSELLHIPMQYTIITHIYAVHKRYGYNICKNLPEFLNHLRFALNIRNVSYYSFPQVQATTAHCQFTQAGDSAYF